MSELSEKRCVPCESSVMPLTLKDANTNLAKIHGWTLADGGRSIRKSFAFKNFSDALGFTNKIGALAESEGHHPDIELKWGSVGIVLSTHAIHGLSINDFVLAAKIDEL